MRSILVLVLVAACGPKSARPTPQPEGSVPWATSGVDWSKPPVVATTPNVVPGVTERKVGDVRVLVVENHRLPVVAITAVNAEAGGRTDNYPHPGLAALTLDVLSEAAPAHPGIRLDTSIATDYASVQIVARKDDVSRAGKLLADTLRNATFDDALVDRVKSRREAALRERQTRQRTVAGQAFDGVVFFGHPYRMPAEGFADDVAQRTATEVRGFWRTYYGPDQLTIVIAGDVNAADVDAIAGGFAKWRGVPPNAVPVIAVPKFAPKLTYVDMPGAEQAVVLVGAQAAKAGEPEQVAADIENTLFGGGPGSQLDKKLDAEMAITTGAGSSFWRGQYAGSWSVAATFPTAKAGDGLRAVLAEVAKARDADASDTEIAQAKQQLSRAVALQFETVAGTARELERIAGQRLPVDWFTTYVGALAKVTPADARAAVTSTWKQPTIVVAGDWAKLKDQLASLGYTATPYAP